MYRGLSSPRIKQYKSVPCFRIASGSIHRDALRACAARPNRVALCVYRAARCGHRALRSSIGKRSVGDDAYIVPPSPAIKLSVGADASVRPPMLYRTSCKRCHCETSSQTGRGERAERCQWQKKRGERVAAVKISSVRRKAAQKFWTPQQGHPHPPSPRPPCLKGAGTAQP